MSGDVSIQPEPAAEEAAAILAVLRLLRQAQPETSTAAVPSRTGWRRAARRESLRGELPHEAGGWLNDR